MSYRKKGQNNGGVSPTKKGSLVNLKRGKLIDWGTRSSILFGGGDFIKEGGSPHGGFEGVLEIEFFKKLLGGFWVPLWTIYGQKDYFNHKARIYSFVSSLFFIGFALTCDYSFFYFFQLIHPKTLF